MRERRKALRSHTRRRPRPREKRVYRSRLEFGRSGPVWCPALDDSLASPTVTCARLPTTEDEDEDEYELRTNCQPHHANRPLKPHKSPRHGR